jgi:hypothetical protein
MESATRSERRRARMEFLVTTPPQPKAPSVPGDDSLRLDDHERCWPSGPKARGHDPEPAVRLRERHPPRSGALEHRQLVPQGKYFKLKRGARMRQRSEGEEEREQYRLDRPSAYPSSTVTSTAATRTDFSVDTAFHGCASQIARRPWHRSQTIGTSYREA